MEKETNNDKEKIDDDISWIDGRLRYYNKKIDALEVQIARFKKLKSDREKQLEQLKRGL